MTTGLVKIKLSICDEWDEVSIKRFRSVLKINIAPLLSDIFKNFIPSTTLPNKKLKTSKLTITTIFIRRYIAVWFQTV